MQYHNNNNDMHKNTKIINTTNNTNKNKNKIDSTANKNKMIKMKITSKCTNSFTSEILIAIKPKCCYLKHLDNLLSSCHG